MNKGRQTGSTSITLLSQMLGASLLSCSFIVHKLGWVLALIAFVFTIVYDIFMYRFIVAASHYTQARSYREVTEKVVSKNLSVLLEISIIITYFGYVTAYIIISSAAIGTFIKNIFHYDANAYVVKAILSSCVIFPLCLLKSLKQLSKVAGISGIAIFIFSFSVIAYFFIHLKSGVLCEGEGKTIKYSLNAFPDASKFMSFLYFLMYIPSLQGNFTAQTIIPTLLKEMQGPGVIKTKIVQISIVIALMLAFFLYIFIGFMGAGMFGSDIQDNLLKSFAPCKWVWIDICGLLYAFIVIVAYPLVLYPIKISIVGMGKKDPNTKLGYKIQVFITICFVVLSTALAMVLESIVAIFGLFAAVSGIIFYFAVPICIIVQFPKLKHENSHLDKMDEGEVVVDPVLVGVMATMGGTVQRARALSNKLFPASENGEEKPRTVSFLKPRTLSIAVEDDGTQKIRTASFVKRVESLSHISEENAKHTEHKEDLLNEVVAEEHSTVTVEEVTVDIGTGEVSKGRKTVGVVSIVIFTLICAVGVGMNGIDVADSFKNKK
ncbi:Amino_acid transporter family protein [Hexamita inflata]|uniref:Amino acid transporter family protein n=1 Tax=Hexamita inflata TaxID=28002 RepID=A0AA86Q4T5_9EUKA|nr:Amino acid transporter family protein [Hexamita inflata]